MTLNIISEEYWGCVLDKNSKEFSWTVSDEDGLERKLCLSQATLGLGAVSGERNIVEVACEDEEGETSSSHAIVSMSIGLLESTPLNVGFSNTVKITLVSGSGPVHIVGNVLTGVFEDESLDESDEDEMEDSSLLADKENAPSKRIKNHVSTKDSDEESDEINSDNDSSDSVSSSDDEPENNTKEASDSDTDDGRDDDEDSDDSDSDEKFKEISLNKPKKGVLKSKSKAESKNINKDQRKNNKKVSFSEDTNLGQKKMDLPSIKIALSKVTSLPKSQEKFKNFMSSNLKVKDQKLINDAWIWVSKNRVK